MHWYRLSSVGNIVLPPITQPKVVLMSVGMLVPIVHLSTWMTLENPSIPIIMSLLG